MSKKKIIIAEDEEMSFYCDVFQEEGYEVIHADDGAKAISELKKHQPEVLLLDLRLPKYDGLEILRELKERKISPKTKVIVWTGFDVYGEPQKTIEENYSDQVAFYLKKPIALDDLLTKVRQVIDSL